MSTMISTLPKIVRQEFDLIKWVTGIGERPATKEEGTGAILTAMRTAVTAAAFFAIHMFPKYKAAITLSTLVVSLPAFGMLFGLYSCSMAINALSKAVLLNKMDSIFSGTIHLITAWNFVKWSKNLPFGLLESRLIKWSGELGDYLYSDLPPVQKPKNDADTLLKLFKKHPFQTQITPKGPKP